MLRFEQHNLAPQSRLARRERFYAALGTGTMRICTVDLRLRQQHDERPDARRGGAAPPLSHAHSPV